MMCVMEALLVAILFLKISAPAGLIIILHTSSSRAPTRAGELETESTAVVMGTLFVRFCLRCQRAVERIIITEEEDLEPEWQERR